jgi:putative zinc finger/helix-turn-helix YgiT family protein
VSRCPKCGETEVAIPRIEDLHRTIARALIQKRSRLTAPEIRFLRKYLGWSGVDFAAHMGATPETISRWEKGAVPIGAASDRLLRLMVASKAPVEDYSLDVLKDIKEVVKSKTVLLGFRARGGGWHADAA